MSLFKRKPEAVPIKAVVAVDYKPGDTLVIECERRVPRDVLNKFRAQIQDQTDCRVLVLEGMELKALLREERS